MLQVFRFCFVLVFGSKEMSFLQIIWLLSGRRQSKQVPFNWTRILWKCTRIIFSMPPNGSSKRFICRFDGIHLLALSAPNFLLPTHLNCIYIICIIFIQCNRIEYGRPVGFYSGHKWHLFNDSFKSFICRHLVQYLCKLKLEQSILRIHTNDSFETLISIFGTSTSFFVWCNIQRYLFSLFDMFKTISMTMFRFFFPKM